jgi:hypothetical protein
VAQPTTCVNQTATATPEPTATLPPPAAVGTPVPYGAGLEITVLSIAPAITPSDLKINGQILQTNYTITNTSSDALYSPWPFFTLSDEIGNSAPVDLELNRAFPETASGGEAIGANTTNNAAVVFDFPDPTATRFIFGSQENPGFRVVVEVIVRG